MTAVTATKTVSSCLLLACRGKCRLSVPGKFQISSLLRFLLLSRFQVKAAAAAAAVFPAGRDGFAFFLQSSAEELGSRVVGERNNLILLSNSYFFFLFNLIASGFFQTPWWCTKWVASCGGTMGLCWSRCGGVLAPPEWGTSTRLACGGGGGPPCPPGGCGW